MPAPRCHPVVHLELHTANLPRACAFLTEVLGWRAERVTVEAGNYMALDWAHDVSGGVVEYERERSLWVPYVEVIDLGAVTERARAAGAEVTLEPREGPAGWRSSLTAPDGTPLALWRPKT